MAEVLKQEGGCLILPAVTENKDKIADPLLQAIMDCRDGKKATQKVATA
jgi:hypothetical protein